MAKEYHVEQGSRTSWHIRREAGDRPFATYHDREAAISAARMLARLNEGVVVVHGENGALLRTDWRGRETSAP